MHILWVWQELSICFSQKEKKDIDDIEAQIAGGDGTKELFIEQNSLEDAKQKELQEYLDAKNKEVIYVRISVNKVVSCCKFPEMMTKKRLGKY